jgi:outer membrane protein OmpA-like peptidoglycan-associated protein
MLRASLLGFIFCFLFTILNAQKKSSREVTFRNGDFKRASFSKAYWAEERYDNKKLKFKGKFLKCTTRQGIIDVFEKRKIGQWMYYYPTGGINRIENYTNAESCNTKISREGKWEYFNQNGELYHEEIFKNDTIISSVLEIYRDSSLYQSVATVNGKLQTLNTVSEETSNDYVFNGDFELYKYKPVLIINDGHNTIEDLIPGWFSPGGTSADYYNYNRKVQDVPVHFDETTNGTGHAGILIYNSRKESYSEHLQTRLKKTLTPGQRYCLTFDVMLSMNSGFFTEKFEAVISSSPMYTYTDSLLTDSLKHITYQHTFDNTSRWQQLCDCFISDGSERYLTLGLFSLNDAGVTKTTERYKSLMDVNTGAYYLIDNVSVKAVSEDHTCVEKLFVKRLEKEKQKKLKGNIFNMLLTGEREAIAFKNVQFETNRSDLKQESFPELEQLKSFLENSNASIEIAGFTDNVGEAEHNQTLSLARAESIKTWLETRGIEGFRMSTVGYGASNFVADNNTEANRQRNRRVEIRLVSASN